MKTALITGITGQDGSYLAELLLSKKYKVVGMLRRTSSGSVERIEHIKDRLCLAPGDVTDGASIYSIIKEHRPDEIYNLASQSFVPASWTQPILTSESAGLGAIRILEAVKSINPKIRFYQASTSEMFGDAQKTPQDEETPFRPRSPYGISKLFAHWATVNYRENFNIFACSGILFNHESPRRGLDFVTRKITDSVAKIKYGISKELRLGNLEAKRDWGFAGDYVEAMWLMLQQETPQDFVISTGEAHSVREFCSLAFAEAGLDYRRYVKEDMQYFRASEVNILQGDYSKARKILKWEPKIRFKELVKMMVQHELEIYGKKAIQEKSS